MYISTVTLKYFLWITEVYSRLPEVAVWWPSECDRTLVPQKEQSSVFFKGKLSVQRDQTRPAGTKYYLSIKMYY